MTYYRCQARNCPTTCVREDVVEDAVLVQFSRLQFSSAEKAWFRPKLVNMKLNSAAEQAKLVNALMVQLNKMDDRLNRLTDAYIDRLIEKELFEQRKSALLTERTDLEQQLADWKSGKRDPAEELLNFLERGDSAYLAYKRGLPEEKRDLLDSLTSNRTVNGKTPEIMLALPFNEIANRHENTNGSPRRDTHRTWRHLLPRLLKLLERETEPEEKIAA